MSKFTFVCEDEPMPFSEGTITKRTAEFSAVQLDLIVQEFEMFLKGCGFSFDGYLTFTTDQVDSFDDLDDNTCK